MSLPTICSIDSYCFFQRVYISVRALRCTAILLVRDQLWLTDISVKQDNFSHILYNLCLVFSFCEKKKIKIKIKNPKRINATLSNVDEKDTSLRNNLQWSHSNDCSACSEVLHWVRVSRCRSMQASLPFFELPPNEATLVRIGINALIRFCAWDNTLWSPMTPTL